MINGFHTVENIDGYAKTSWFCVATKPGLWTQLFYPDPCISQQWFWNSLYAMLGETSVRQLEKRLYMVIELTYR